MAKTNATTLIINNASVTINGVSIRCEAYYTEFALNSIPVAKFHLAPDAGDIEVSSIYEKLEGVSVGDDVTLTATFTGKFNNDPSSESSGLDGVPIDVFKGKVVGWGPLLRRSTMKVVLWASHPLCTLDWSSAMVDEIHGRGMNYVEMQTRGAADMTIIPYMAPPYSEDSSALSDIWENIIKPEFRRIAEFTRFGQDNNAALEFLDNFDVTSEDGKPLSLVSNNPLAAIADIRRTIMMPESGTTLWDTLVSLANRYMFAISPRVDGASMVPFVPTLNSSPSVTFIEQEFSRVSDWRSFTGRLFSSVGVFEGGESYPHPFDVEPRTSVAENVFAEGPNPGYSAGLYKAPGWLQAGLDLSDLTGATTNRTGKVSASGYVLAPSQVDATDSPNIRYNAGGDATKAYAEMLLSAEQFRQRTAVIKGALRYDIAPGNLVSLLLPRAGEDADPIYGTVRSVVAAFDNQARKSGVWVSLSNVRTKKEHDELELSTHPMYNQSWVRSPLKMIEGHTHGVE